MKLSKLFAEIGIAVKEEQEILAITNDSRKVTKGSLFISMNGSKQVDYGAYIADAEARGAVAVLTEEKRETSSRLPQYITEHARADYALLSAAFFGFPAKKLKLVGVTGTNGKTSTAYYTKAILEASGHKTGLIGTIETLAGDEILQTGLTTPEPFELHRIFALMCEKGMEFAVMECSSQALDQQRLYGLTYEAMGFTNLTQDHLDYHKTFTAYREAKALAFQNAKRAVLNRDDASSDYFASFIADRKTYSTQTDTADFFAADISFDAHSATFTLGNNTVSAPAPGNFAVSNALCAIALACAVGVSREDACKGMNTAKAVKGRAEICPVDADFTVLIDYAHTPDAMMNILKAVESEGRKIVLFGCGGDRDSEKRPLMASIAARYGDLLIITSDNPRSEEPQAIIDDILLGLHNVEKPYVTVPDRREAIAYALKNAQKGDTVFLLGKGHEDYQILNTGKIHFDEREIVREIMKEINA